jgi:hypothetical protein
MPMQDRETEWLKAVYQPGVRQLTVRAVLGGMVIGVLMCLSNLYVFFKTGWSMGRHDHGGDPGLRGLPPPALGRARRKDAACRRSRTTCSRPSPPARDT